MGSPNLLLRRTLTAALAGVLSLGLLTAGPPARSEPVGVAVPTFRGGTITAWGDPALGQKDVPAGLAGKSVTAIVSEEQHSLALTSDGKVTAWGNNSHHQSDVPTDELAGKTVTAIAAGQFHSLALTSDGKVTAWGSNDDGQTSVPDELAGKTVTAIAAGQLHSLALTSDGKVTAWGSGDNGQAGVPADLDGKVITAISAGRTHNLVLTSDGKVIAWGWNSNDETRVPGELAGKTVTAIAAGSHHSLALTSDGKVLGWGLFSPAHVPDELAGETVTAIAAGTQHSMALTSDGKVAAWGLDVAGESTTPSDLDGKIITALAAGQSVSMVIATDFRAEGKPTISGPAVIGGPLTANPGRYTAAPGKVTYQWYAAGAPIIGATNATYHPAGAQLGKQLTVQARAVLRDFDPVVTTSDPTAPITRGQEPGPTVPAVKLEASKPAVRRGQPVTLSWSSTGATSVASSGGWTGTRAGSGSVQVKPTKLGTTTYTLTATNSAGATTSQVQVKVTRPPAKLKVTAAKGKHRAGKKVKITVRGLEAGEKYTIRVGKKKIAGTAKNARPLVRSIPLPRAGGRATIRVTGDQPDRTGTAKVRVLRR